jgi:copper chaperone CopZ
MIESTVLTVTGMKCGGCESNVVGKLQQLDGVVTVQASHKDNQVSVEFDSEKTDVDALTAVISAAGFVVEA